MEPKTVVAYVTLVTILANLFFAYTGVTATVSCTVTQAAAAAYAAVLGE